MTKYLFLFTLLGFILSSSSFSQNATPSSIDFPSFSSTTMPADSLATEIDEENSPSIRAEQASFYTDTIKEQEVDWFNFKWTDFLKTSFMPPKSRDASCRLDKEVYGYHPHWFGPDYYLNYDYSLLSTFTYFSYELNPYTGGYKTIHDWENTRAVDLAKAAGCKVDLCVTNFGGANNNRFLNNPKAWSNLATQVAQLLNLRQADGVNLDFEQIRFADKEKWIRFVHQFSAELKRIRPRTRISIAVPPVDEKLIYDIAAMASAVDLFIIMGYDYHYSNSKQAGPVAPLDGYISLRSTLSHYLAMGVHPEKLILAVPYYGREWQTHGSSVPSNTKAYLRAPMYKDIKNRYYGRYTPKWDNRAASPYFVKGAAQDMVQCWFESDKSLCQKYDLVMQQNLGGVGIWALGYDNGYADLWTLLEEKFMQCNGTSSSKRQPSSVYQRIVDYYYGSKK